METNGMAHKITRRSKIMKKQQKLLVASLVAIPAAVAVAGSVQAAETTLPTFEVHNDFVHTTGAATFDSTVETRAKTKSELHTGIMKEMSNYTKGFTITYEAGTAENYQADIEELFETIKQNLNTASSTIDYTMLYGTFNNMRVDATELKNDAGVVQGVVLRFSLNYFMDLTAQAALNNLAYELTNPDSKNAIINKDMNDVQKLKAIHDYVVTNSYVIPTNHNLSALVLNNYGSSHAYALLTAKLLKAAGIQANYVTGIVDGILHSWNVVELGGKYYHFDAASNDNATPKSNYVSYRYFLAGNADTGNRHIKYGLNIIDIAQWGTLYPEFMKIVNPAVVGTKLYFADAAFGGTIKVYDLADPTKPATVLPTEATSSHGGVAYYQLTSTDSVTVVSEDLYFINNAVGNFLYKYNLRTNEVTLIDNTSVASLEVRRANLVYITVNGTQKTITLNDVKSFNQGAADGVIAAINTLDIVTGGALTARVIEARQKYNSLTPDQRTLIPAEILKKLLDRELTLSGTDTAVRNLTATINALDPLDPTYITKVKNAMDDYTLLGAAKQGLIYNVTILNLAYQQVVAAESLKGQIATFVITGDESPFSSDANSLVILEQINAAYDALLPSLKQAIPSQHLIYLNSYKAEAIALKASVQELVNEINIITVNAGDYLNKMASIKVRYEQQFFASQKALLTEDQKTKVETNIALATTMLEETAAFEAIIETILGDATPATLVLTSENVAQAQQAKAMYDKMKPSQKQKVSAKYATLQSILTVVATIVTDPAVVTVDTMITALDHTKSGLTLAAFIAQVTSADAAYIALNYLKIGISPASVTKLTTYKEKIDGIEARINAVQVTIDALTSTSTKAEVQAVRAAYDALSDVAQHFVNIANLLQQEGNLELIDDQAAADIVIASIAALSAESTLKEILAAEALYAALNTKAKGLVSNYGVLIQLKANKQSEIDAMNRQAQTVTELIAALTERSTVAQVRAARSAYDALDIYVQELVTNYNYLLEIELALKEQIGNQQNQELALELDNAILAITNTTSLEVVMELYQRYTEASAGVKALMREVALLERWYTQKTKENEAAIEQAKKEAKLVYDRIEKISETHTEAHIRAIRIAYEALSTLAKTFVTNLEKLEAAEANIIYEETTGKEVRNEAAAFDAFMAKLDRKSEKDEIRDARRHYDRLSVEAKKYVTSYNKLKRLEEMFSDKDYEDLFENYYPHYQYDPKPGGIEPTESTYDKLYIPDDSTQYFAYTEYKEKESTLVSGGYIKIDPAQLKHNTNKTITFTATNNIEITLPVAELKNASGTIGVTLKADNSELIVTFTENNRLKTFTDNVTIKVPFDILDATIGMKVEGITYSGVKETVVYKVSGTNFLISTKQSGTFTAQAAIINYTDLGQVKSSAATAIRELAKRGITSGAVNTQYQPTTTVKRKDVAVMITQALKLTTTATTKYTDVRTSASTESQAVLEAGIMRGITATQFKPFNELTREEAAIIIANVLRQQKLPIAITSNPQTTSYKDAKTMTYEGQQSVAVLELAGILNGTGNFNPNAKLKRSEFAELLYNALKKIDSL